MALCPREGAIARVPSPTAFLPSSTKFPTGPWCKEGQIVVYGRYSGARFKTRYGEHRILNDDEIIGTINQPEDILALF